MAQIGYVSALLGGLEATTRRILQQVFDYLLINSRFGRPTHQDRAENFQAYFLTSTTPATANEDFSVAHGLGTTPYLALPVLDLSDSLAQTVPLRVSRAADGQRVYLRSTSTAARFTVLVEG